MFYSDIYYYMRLLELYKQVLNEDMGYENLSQINIDIPFDKLVVDKVNLTTAIENIRGGRPSRSKDNPMQVARSNNGKYYLLDGYHRFVEAILNGKKRTKGILLNKPYEELSKANKIGVGCHGWQSHMKSYDEFCSNFKELGSIDMIKQTFSK